MVTNALFKDRESTDLLSLLSEDSFKTLKGNLAPYEPSLSLAERSRRLKQVEMINNELNSYERTKDPKSRWILLHKFYGYFVRCPDLNSKEILFEEDLLKSRILGLLSVPYFNEDKLHCQNNLSYVLAA